MINNRKLNEILEKLTYEEQDTLYRKLWKEHVKADIQSFMTEEDIELSEKEVNQAAERYVGGRYDCNLSYWENVRNVIDDVVS